MKDRSRVRRRLVAAWAAIIVLVLMGSGCGSKPTATRLPATAGPTEAIKPTATALPVETGAPTNTPEPTVTAIATTGPALTRVPGATSTPAVVPSQTPVDTIAPTDSPQPTAPPAGVSVQGFAFGPFHLPDTEFGSVFTGAFRALSREDALPTLEAARKAGVHLIIHLTGGRNRHQTAAGAFSVEMFNHELDLFRDIDLTSYVADGTVVGHLLFDEPQDPSNWNGAPVPFEDIEAVAAYSKALWPTLPVGVGGPASFLEAKADWSVLDFAFSQYTTARGDIKSWIQKEASAAEHSGLGLVFSINVLGGNNRNPVTAQQLTEWGTLLAQEPHVCALLMWKYDVGYFGDPAIADALASIADIARQRADVSCQP